MQEERDAIEQTARQLLDAMPDATSRSGTRSTAYTDGLTNSLYLDDAQADYARASEVLSLRDRGGLRVRRRRAHRHRRSASWTSVTPTSRR